MRVTKSYHDAPEGIELAFDPELRHEGLQKYLGALGFKEANRKKGVWYIRGKRPSYDRYTDALIKAYNDGKDVMEMVIQPSYEPSLENITHKMFSLVTATITTETEKTEKTKNIDYVIFEDFRVSAFDIANRFLKQQYGDRLELVRVTAKNLKGRAEKALAKEQIIVSTSLSEIVEEKPENELSVTASPSLSNDAGVYTEALAKDRYEEIKIPMPSKLKFEARMALVQDEQDQYVYGVNVINNLSGWSGYGFAPSKGDASYPTKSEAIQAAILQILDGLQYEHTEALRMGASQALQAAYKKTILAIYDFADRIEINIPQEKSKAVLPLSMDEETPKNAEGTKQSTLNTFDKDVAMLVDELRELETQTEDKGIAFTIGNAKIDLEESFEKFTGKPLNDQLKHIYSGLLDLVR